MKSNEHPGHPSGHPSGHPWLRSLLRALRRHSGDPRGSGTPAGLAELNTNYDLQTVEVLRRVLRSDSNCVDVGAHEGAILEPMVAIAPAGAHHAFEPLPHLAARLRRRFPGVTIHEAAAADRSGTAEFQHVENDPAYSGLRRRVYDRSDPVIRVLRVQAVRIDDAVPPDQDFAFMKLDIEGGEFHALRGAASTVRRCRPTIVFEAGQKSTGQYGVTPEELFALVTTELGYELSTMKRWLGDQLPYDRAEFLDNWSDGPDFYFLATPARLARR